MLASSLKKGVFRFLHIMSGCFAIGNAISDMFWEPREDTGYIVLSITCGIILLVSGIANIILLKPSKIFNEEDKKLWSAFVYTKLGLWFLFLHIPDWFFSLFGYKFPRNEFNFFLVIIVTLLSVTAKVFRDAAVRCKI